jgi:regulator of sirC expression with transglutaminase-like and TPR domain
MVEKFPKSRLEYSLLEEDRKALTELTLKLKSAFDEKVGMYNQAFQDIKEETEERIAQAESVEDLQEVGQNLLQQAKKEINHLLEQGKEANELLQYFEQVERDWQADLEAHAPGKPS